MPIIIKCCWSSSPLNAINLLNTWHCFACTLKSLLHLILSWNISKAALYHSRRYYLMALCAGMPNQSEKSTLKLRIVYLYPVISGLAVAEQMKRTLAPSVTVWGWTERVTEGGSANRKAFMLLTWRYEDFNTIHLILLTGLNVFYRLLYTLSCYIVVLMGKLMQTLTLDIDSDWSLSSSRGSWVKNPAGVGASRVAILRDDRKHTDSCLSLPIFHHCL